MYYYAASRTPLTDLVNDCLIQAHNSGFDVFNALDIMNNKEFLKKLKFGDGDGNLQYYVYNWKCPLMPPENAWYHASAYCAIQTTFNQYHLDQTKHLMTSFDSNSLLQSTLQKQKKLILFMIFIFFSY
ncbi:unnamed protein product [Adineta steineri]|uniref:Glycylpeptide N-tetradecanoyltransferase n=1 Tax=Adineta steineri TaxID=433720 RepID=A0A820CWT7_9BILA|nr:unnamed protein product [Adineta steineri]